MRISYYNIYKRFNMCLEHLSCLFANFLWKNTSYLGFMIEIQKEERKKNVSSNLSVWTQPQKKSEDTAHSLVAIFLCLSGCCHSGPASEAALDSWGSLMGPQSLARQAVGTGNGLADAGFALRVPGRTPAAVPSSCHPATFPPLPLRKSRRVLPAPLINPMSLFL